MLAIIYEDMLLEEKDTDNLIELIERIDIIFERFFLEPEKQEREAQILVAVKTKKKKERLPSFISKFSCFFD